MKTLYFKKLFLLLLHLLSLTVFAQVNSGSDGRDGVLNPTGNLVINMTDHPDGIYHYKSINIPDGVTVSFVPNSSSAPVTWLIQEDCLIKGKVIVSGAPATGGVGGSGGPGGWAGGSSSQRGYGPGGGDINRNGNFPYAGGGTFGGQGNAPPGSAVPPVYGNSYLLPLLGGSGGGGHPSMSSGGGGGGGAILIASSKSVIVTGSVVADGASSGLNPQDVGHGGGGGSGGAIRIVALKFTGTGEISARSEGTGGDGRIRIDAFDNTFGGKINGIVAKGFQPIIIPASGEGVQLTIKSVAGVQIQSTPSGVVVNPDVIISAQQANPVSVVIQCANLPLNTEISVVVRPVNGPDMFGSGFNTEGSKSSSAATISLNLPRGGGIIYAKAVTAVSGTAFFNPSKKSSTQSIAMTGWTAEGERFVKMEIMAALGGQQQNVGITESGKRYMLSIR